MNEQLKLLVEDLGAAINEALAEAPRINEAIEKIRASGHDVFLILEATICLENREGERVFEEPAPLEMNAEDRQFLKSLKIKFDDHE